LRREKHSLREIKHARTKIAIMKALVAAMGNARYDDISIKRICRDAEISEGTFFNYFSEKIEIVHFFIQTLLLKAIWQAQRFVPKRHKLLLVEAVMENLAGSIPNANIMYQLIAAMINQRELPRKGTVTALERELLYPGCEGIEEIKMTDIESFFAECLKGAVKNGELSKNADLEDAAVSLMTILTGTLLATKFSDNDNGNIVYHFKRQLRILWRGIGALMKRGCNE